jgi:hypothetical protein
MLSTLVPNRRGVHGPETGTVEALKLKLWGKRVAAANTSTVW